MSAKNLHPQSLQTSTPAVRPKDEAARLALRLSANGVDIRVVAEQFAVRLVGPMI
ncbi:MAG: hypothetical protein JO077_27120 [Verrucomicrobia bacterium]|nr:hypothetical protein [Verrucomicrobiota bacterium]